MKDMHKILVVGDFHSDFHEQAIYDALLALGFDAHKFAWHSYFGTAPYLRDVSRLAFVLRLWPKVQYHFAFGPTVLKMNRDLLRMASEIAPDLVFVYRGTHILPATLKKLKRSGAVVFGYNNDDPFGSGYSFHFWRHFKRSIPLYDHIFAYRSKNILDYKRIGYNSVSLLRSYYIAERNFPMGSLPDDSYVSDVSFVGHFEDDGRDECLKDLIDRGVNVKLFGSEWGKSKHYDYFVEKLGPITPLGKDYNLVINSAKICLVFLSKLNNDTYTRRCFEIPAAKKFMLSEYSDDLKNLFAEGSEAEYFRSREELLEKVAYYLAHAEAREAIALGGFKRVQRDGHEVKDRVKEILTYYQL